MATIHGAWKAISPPNKEDEVMGKWFGVASHGGKVPMLHVAKLLRHFVDDENGMSHGKSGTQGCSASYSISLTM